MSVCSKCYFLCQSASLWGWGKNNYLSLSLSISIYMYLSLFTIPNLFLGGGRGENTSFSLSIYLSIISNLYFSISYTMAREPMGRKPWQVTTCWYLTDCHKAEKVKHTDSEPEPSLTCTVYILYRVPGQNTAERKDRTERAVHVWARFERMISRAQCIYYCSFWSSCLFLYIQLLHDCWYSAVWVVRVF